MIGLPAITTPRLVECRSNFPCAMAPRSAIPFFSNASISAAQSRSNANSLSSVSPKMFDDDGVGKEDVIQTSLVRRAGAQSHQRPYVVAMTFMSNEPSKAKNVQECDISETI